MNKTLIQQLVINSTSDNKIDSKKVLDIANQLSKKHLREYIRLLKKYIAEHTVVVESAMPLTEMAKKDFSDVYKNKDVQFVINKDLMLGIRIKENDIIYSRNLRETLENITHFVTQ